MSRSIRALIREAGAAFAVLAIYVLTLLTPLHQAEATQRGFAALGYDTIGVWSICAVSSAADDTDMPAAVKCPVAGPGKVGAATDGAVAPAAPAFVAAIVHPGVADAPAKTRNAQGNSPRAPPVVV